MLERLVHGYPSHDYTIDYRALQEIGCEAKLFEENERGAVQGLFKLLHSSEATVVTCISPTPTAQDVVPGSTEAAAS